MKTKLEVLSLSKTLTYLIYLASFAVPFLLGRPQVLVGTIVNATLIAIAISDKKWGEILPVILFPSLGVIARGLIFGSFTPLLLYMVPSIWIGNAILIATFRYLKNNYSLNLIVGSVLKTMVLFGMANFWVGLNILPKVFLTSMGMIQLTTALLGGLTVWGIRQFSRE